MTQAFLETAASRLPLSSLTPMKQVQERFPRCTFKLETVKASPRRTESRIGIVSHGQVVARLILVASR